MKENIAFKEFNDEENLMVIDGEKRLLVISKDAGYREINKRMMKDASSHRQYEFEFRKYVSEVFRKCIVSDEMV